MLNKIRISTLAVFPNNVFISIILAHILLFVFVFFQYSYPTVITIWFIFTFLLVKYNKLKYKLNSNLIFNIYIYIELISLFGYLVNDYSRFINDRPYIISAAFMVLIIPQLYFYNCGVYLNKSKFESILRLIIYLNFFGVLFGLLCYFVRPDFFESYIFRNDTLGKSTARMISYFGTAMISGLVCSTSIILTYKLITRQLVKYLFITFFTVGLILSMSRGAWGATLVAMAIMLIFDRKSIKLSSLFVFILIILLAYYLCSSLLDDYFQSNDFINLLNRFSNFGGAAGERTNQWENTLSFIKDYPFGGGIGLFSHKAINSGMGFIVADGNYFRILAELGIGGLLIFLILLLLSLYVSFVNKEFYLTSILVIYSIQAVGTNVFDLFYISFIFWLMQGYIFNMKTNVRNSHT